MLRPLCIEAQVAASKAVFHRCPAYAAAREIGYWIVYKAVRLWAALIQNMGAVLDRHINVAQPADHIFSRRLQYHFVRNRYELPDNRLVTKKSLPLLRLTIGIFFYGVNPT